MSETESQQVTRYINGLKPTIQEKYSLVPVYTLDDAFNLAIKVENQITKTNHAWNLNRNRLTTDTPAFVSQPTETW